MQKVFFDKDNENKPYTAVNGVFFKVIAGKKNILLGKRKNVSGAGYYYLPGGHIKLGETIEKALIREMKEECGVKVKKGRLLWVEESLGKRHHIIFYYESILDDNIEPRNIEPDKCEGWHWFPINELPKPLWHNLKQFTDEESSKKRIDNFAKSSVDYIGVGVGAVIFNKKGQILFQKRGIKAKNEIGKWKLPGGQINFGETAADALIRELKEELNINTEVMKLVCCLDDFILNEKQHWLVPIYVCKIKSGRIKNMEKEKIADIKWFSPNRLPDNLAYGTNEIISMLNCKAFNDI